VGNCMPLKRVPVGLDVHNIEMMPGQGGRFGFVPRVWRPVGGSRRRLGDAAAAVGRDAAGSGGVPGDDRHLGNADHQNIQIGKAGRKRHMGRRPQPRNSMNRSPSVGRRRGSQRRRPGIPAARGASWPRAARPVRPARTRTSVSAPTPKRSVRAAGDQEEVSLGTQDGAG